MVIGAWPAVVGQAVVSGLAHSGADAGGMTSSRHDPAIRPRPGRCRRRRPRGPRLRRRAVGTPVPLSPPEPLAVRRRHGRARLLVDHRPGLPAGHRRDHDRGRRRRRLGRSRPARPAPVRPVLRAGGRQLPPDVPARRRRGTRRRAAPRRPVRAAGDVVARLPRRSQGGGARVASVERRDARADDAHPDGHEPAVVGHRARRLGHHPVHAQSDVCCSSSCSWRQR